MDKVPDQVSQKNGDDTAMASAAQDAWNINVCEPKTIKDYAVGFSTAGISFAICAAKYFRGDASDSKKSK